MHCILTLSRRHIARAVSRADTVFIVLALSVPFLGLDRTVLAQCCDDTEEQELTASDGEEFDDFANDVGLSGDVAVFGSPFHTINLVSSGAAYVFGFSNGTWSEEQILVGGDSASGDQFGDAVAIDGEVMVVGASEDDLSQGAAYVFRFDSQSSQWEEEQKLVASDKASGDLFGRAVAISGSVIMIGAPNSGVSSTGQVYAFRYIAGTWVEEDILQPSILVANDDFGGRVAVDGDVMVTAGTAFTDGGRASVFRFNDQTDEWDEEFILDDPNTAPGDSYGSSVSVSGDAICIGVPGNDDQGSAAGKAFVYRFNGGTGDWEEEGVLFHCAPSSQDQFGRGVSISNHRIVVGAWLDAGVGSMHVYRFDGSDWNHVARLTVSNAQSQDELGEHVAIDINRIIGGAARSDNSTGAAFFFDDFGDCDCVADTNSDDVVDVADLIEVIVSWGTSMASGDVDNSGLVDVQDLIAVITNWGRCPGTSGSPPPSLQAFVEASGLVYPDDWNLFLINIEDANYRCWMDHYLARSRPPKVSSHSPCWGPNCPASDPFGGH